MLDAATEPWRGATDSVEPKPEVTPELVLVVGSPVGQRLLRELPHAFVGVEFRGVARKAVQVEPREGTAQGTDRLALVDGAPIPEENHGAAEMAEQMPDEVADLGMLDVLRVEMVVQAEMTAAWTHGDSGDGGDPITPLPVVEKRCPSARRPRPAHTGNQEEARLVGEDDVGTQPRGFFLMRGHCSLFQRSIASSSRSSARRSGF